MKQTLAIVAVIAAGLWSTMLCEFPASAIPGYGDGNFNGSPYYDASPYGWTQSGAPYGNGLTLEMNWAWGSAYGIDHDCGSWPFAVPRDGLYIHKTNAAGSGNYITQGCSKINGADMANFDAVYHFWATWGGADGSYYGSTALAWG